MSTGTFANLTRLLEERAQALSPTEMRLAGHLVEHPERWGFSSTTRLAAELDVHRSTIVRFAQRLGFSGYVELQEAVRNTFMQSLSASDLVLTAPGAFNDGAITELYDRELRNLRQTYANLDMEVLEATARGVARARRVLVFGRRFSYPIALHLSLTLNAIRDGVRLAPEPGGSSIDGLFDLEAADYALLVSLRRHSSEVQRTLAFLTNRRVPHTLLTDSSPIGNTHPQTRLIRTHIGSTSVLESYTALTSVSHTLLTLISRRLPESQQRLAEVEKAWAHFNRL